MTDLFSLDVLKIVAPEFSLTQTGRSDQRDAVTRPFSTQSAILSDHISSNLVKIGNTAVLAGVKLSTMQASQGVLSVSVIPPFGWSKRDQSALVGQLNVSLNADVVDMSTSFSISGRHVWHIEIGIVVLEDDGSVFDACQAAAISVLRNFRFPDLDSSFQVTTESDAIVNVGRPIALKSLPLCLTFRRVCGRLLADCTKMEEAVATGTFVFRLMESDVGISDWQGPLETEEVEVMTSLAREVLLARLADVEGENTL